MSIAKSRNLGAWLIILATLLFSAPYSCGWKTYDGPPWEYYGYGGCSLSPDSSLIAFDFSGLNYNGIFLMDRFGKIFSWLCEDNDEWSSGDPVFSPDGKQIAFFRGKHDGPWHIYMMNADGTNIRRITSGTQVDRAPVFSKDGQRIYFIRHKGLARSEGVGFYSGDIFCVDVNTGIEKRLTNLAMYNVKNLSVLPDEKSCIITTTSFEKQGNTCWKLDLTGSDKKWQVLPDFSRYTDNPLHLEENVLSHTTSEYIEILNPVLSANGKMLAFSWRIPKRYGPVKHPFEVYMANMDNMQARQITHFKNVAYLRSMSQDGRTMLVMRSHPAWDYGDPYIEHSPFWVVAIRDKILTRNLPLDFRGMEGKKAVIRYQEYDLNGLVK